MAKSTKSTFSLVAGILAVIVLGVVVHYVASRALSESLERAVVTASETANEDLTQLFINDVYDALEPTIRLSSNISQQNDALRQEEYERINKRIREFMVGTDFLKIKLYNLKGITLYSSDPRQLGADYSTNLGFVSALRGVPFSVSELRSEFNGYSGVVYDRDVVSSYVPIRRSMDGANSAGRIVGVAEIYADRTEAMHKVRDESAELSFLLALGMFIALVFMAGVVWYLSLSMTERYISAAEEQE